MSRVPRCLASILTHLDFWAQNKKHETHMVCLQIQKGVISGARTKCSMLIPCLSRLLPASTCCPTLHRSDNGQRDTWITSSAMQWSMPYRLPAGVACDTGCVLQFKWFAMQTCVEPGCDRTYCGTYADGINMVYGNKPGFCSSTSAQPEYFANCAGEHSWR